MFLKLIALMQVIAIKGNNFDILINSDASASAFKFSLISKERVLSVISCLSTCSLNSNCLTVVYSTIEFNCYWFNDHLDPSDIVASTSSNLYLKKISKNNNMRCNNTLISFLYLKVVLWLQCIKTLYFKQTHLLSSIFCFCTAFVTSLAQTQPIMYWIHSMQYLFLMKIGKI